MLYLTEIKRNCELKCENQQILIPRLFISTGVQLNTQQFSSTLYVYGVTLRQQGSFAAVTTEECIPMCTHKEFTKQQSIHLPSSYQDQAKDPDDEVTQ